MPQERLIHNETVRFLRLRAQGLLRLDAEPLPGPDQIAASMAGAQAQDLPAALLSVAVRSSKMTMEQVDQARQAGALIRTWAMRGTLHVLSREDAAWLIPFLGPIFGPANLRRAAELGWDADRRAEGIRLVREALSELGPLTREEIIQLLQKKGLPSTGQAPIHLIYQAAMDGILCNGPDRGKQATYIRWEDWAGASRPLPREIALTELARRYLQAFAPAAPEDFASWSGLKTGDARRAWELISNQVRLLDGDGPTLWILQSQAAWLEDLRNLPRPVVRLLPRFDTYLLGYQKRTEIVAPAFDKRVNAGGGIIHPVLLVDGRALGLWKTSRRARSLDLTLEPFEPLDPELKPALDQEVERLGQILGISINSNF